MLILILVMTVALAIGISVVQRSLSDISTSTKVEQSSRAFSAAEAGIEQALINPDVAPLPVDFFGSNQSSAAVTGGTLIPAVAAVGSTQAALEHPPLSKEENAHVWLAEFTSNTNPPPPHYTQNSLYVYWGDPNAADKAALEVTLIYYDGGYKSQKWYLDQPAANRSAPNNFDTSVECPAAGSSFALGSSTYYKCRKGLYLPSSGLMMLTARLLYNKTSQPFAVQAVGTCGQPCSIPPQARIFTSTGTAGQTQRKIKLFQTEMVAPPYFDYGLFSAGDINK